MQAVDALSGGRSGSGNDKSNSAWISRRVPVVAWGQPSRPAQRVRSRAGRAKGFDHPWPRGWRRCSINASAEGILRGAEMVSQPTQHSSSPGLRPGDPRWQGARPFNAIARKRRALDDRGHRDKPGDDATEGGDPVAYSAAWRAFGTLHALPRQKLEFGDFFRNGSSAGLVRRFRRRLHIGERDEHHPPVGGPSRPGVPASFRRSRGGVETCTVSPGESPRRAMCRRAREQADRARLEGVEHAGAPASSRPVCQCSSCRPVVRIMGNSASGNLVGAAARLSPAHQLGEGRRAAGSPCRTRHHGRAWSGASVG